MTARPIDRIPAVPLAEVLAADRPLPSSFIDEATFVVPSGRTVRLADVGLPMTHPDNRTREIIRTWRLARTRRHHGWAVARTVHVRYGTGSGAWVPASDLPVAIRSLTGVPLPVRALPGRVVWRHLGAVEAQILPLRAIGDTQVEVVSAQTWERYRSIEGLQVATDAELADLAARLDQLNAARAAVEAWWAALPPLKDAVRALRAQQPAG